MSSSMQASREEIFGPVVAFYKSKTEDDLIERVNRREVSLAAYLYIDTLSTAWQLNYAKGEFEFIP